MHRLLDPSRPATQGILTFRRVFYSGDGDPVILNEDDCTDRNAANRVFRALKLRNISYVGVLMRLA